MLKSLVFVVLAACGGSKPAPAPASGHEQGSDTSLTAQQCSDTGGEVINDIGDGATQRPDYKCAKSGQPPLGHITAEPGMPVPIEGAVCCK